jgi:MOSC domain-containing protein YiiM
VAEAVVSHVTAEELEAGVDDIGRAPADEGSVELIVRRPEVGEREVLDEALLDVEEGLVGDGWRSRGSRRTADGSAHPDMQLTLMNARAIALIARDRDRWPLAGDQLYVDFDLSVDNLPAGTRLAIGEAVIELTEVPHTGCAKFSARFGTDALKFVNKSPGRELRLRGANARIVEPGTVRVGDAVSKII